MFVIPSIDPMAGEVVRLAQGKATEKKVYSQDPMAVPVAGRRQEDEFSTSWIWREPLRGRCGIWR